MQCLYLKKTDHFRGLMLYVAFCIVNLQFSVFFFFFFFLSGNGFKKQEECIHFQARQL